MLHVHMQITKMMQSSIIVFQAEPKVNCWIALVEESRRG
ncbi:unnamed protein product, partial [Linum tenue]